MTKQQKEVTLLKKQIRKLERDKRLLEEQLHRSGNNQRYWQREYNRLLEDIQFNKKSKTKSIVNPSNPDPINRV